MKELDTLRAAVAKQLEFGNKKLAEAESFSVIESWHGYNQALKYVLLQIDTLNEKKR